MALFKINLFWNEKYLICAHDIIFHFFYKFLPLSRNFYYYVGVLISTLKFISLHINFFFTFKKSKKIFTNLILYNTTKSLYF